MHESIVTMGDIPNTPVMEERPLTNEGFFNRTEYELEDTPSGARPSEDESRRTSGSHGSPAFRLSNSGNSSRMVNINVVDKNMRQNFQGRSNGVKEKSARIRWFKNRRSQIMGLCLTTGMLGVTLIFSTTYQWAGLVAGSVVSIVCGSAVVNTYCRRKNWHQHPNPIVLMRSVLSIGFAICLLANLSIKNDANTNPENCRILAGITEFFIISSEAWGLMMACDLFSSLMSPFTNYKRLVKIYHFWVWTLAIGFSVVMWSADGAAGFFRVDGIEINTLENTEELVGFCLASSRKCCNKMDVKCIEENRFRSCDKDAAFLDTQRWPWFLVYDFVMFVLFVSVVVLILAWHRLYLRGVPKTYHIRLRVLNYVSFFTGAYVFYWLLLLLLYMSAYFVSSKDKQDKESMEATNGDATIARSPQTLRQVVIFAIAAKGYLDYVIWFAVNSIEWKRKRNNRSRNDDDDEDGDDDVDLSPQVNTALRSEILYFTTTGIRQSVNEAMVGLSAGEEQILLSTGEVGKDSQNIKFHSYAPQTFRCIREFFGIKDHEYTLRFGATTKERFSEGRSGAFMFFTSDESMIVKTMSKEEADLLRKMASDYASYLFSHPQSLLTRFYGCHSVQLYGKMYYFVVMGNLFADTGVVHYRYDIKGSWVDRNASLPSRGDAVHCRYCNASYTFGSRRHQECGDGLNYHEPNIVLKDNDLLTKVRIDPTEAENLYMQLCADSEFLCSKGIMDYSLLMGVHSCEYYVEPGNFTASMENPYQTTPPSETDQEELQDEEMEMRHLLDQKSLGPPAKKPVVASFRSKAAMSVNGPALYHFGVIDFLQEWTVSKKLERFYKSRMLRKDSDGVSSMPPRDYRARFQQKMAQIFAVSLQNTTVSEDEEGGGGGGGRHAHNGLLDVMDQSSRPGMISNGTLNQEELRQFIATQRHSISHRRTSNRNSTSSIPMRKSNTAF